MIGRIRENRYYQRLSSSNVLFAGLVGLVAGWLVWLLSLLLQAVIIVPLFCNSPDNFTVCASGGTYAWWVAAVVVLLASLFALVRRQVYRPLLVIMAAVATLWGIWAWLGYLEWWQALLWQGLLFGLAYALYALLARIPNFGLSLAAMVAAIIIVRLVSLTA